MAYVYYILYPDHGNKGNNTQIMVFKMFIASSPCILRKKCEALHMAPI